MKKFTLLFTLLISISAVSQTLYRLLERESYIYEGGNWVQTGETTYQYEDGGINATFELFQTVEGGAFTDYSREFKDYDANGMLTEVIREIKEGGPWIKDYRQTYTFNEEGKILQTVRQIGIGDNWEDQFKIDFSYPDEATTVTSSYSYQNGVWNQIEEVTDVRTASNWLQSIKMSVNGTLMNSRRIETSYKNDKIVERILEVWYSNLTPPSWVNEERYMVFYDGSGNIEREETYEWNTNLSTADWELTEKVLHTMSNTNPVLIKIYQDCENGTCTNNRRETRSDYPNGSLHIKALDDWNPDLGDSGDWEDENETIYEYDENGNWAKITTKNIPFANPEEGLQFFSQLVFYYEEAGTLSLESKSLFSAHPYPNPAVDVLNISFAHSLDQRSEVKFYDLQGKLIQSNLLEPGQTLHKIKLNPFSNGLYKLHLETELGVEVHQIIKTDH